MNINDALTVDKHRDCDDVSGTCNQEKSWIEWQQDGEKDGFGEQNKFGKS